jgi:hypothetical protein
MNDMTWFTLISTVAAAAAIGVATLAATVASAPVPRSETVRVGVAA